MDEQLENEAQGVLDCGCPDGGFSECPRHGESGTLAEGPIETDVDERMLEHTAEQVLASLSPHQRRIMAAVHRQQVGEPAVRVARLTGDVFLRKGLMERGAPGQGSYTTPLGDVVARLAAGPEDA